MQIRFLAVFVKKTTKDRRGSTQQVLLISFCIEHFKGLLPETDTTLLKGEWLKDLFEVHLANISSANWISDDLRSSSSAKFGSSSHGSEAYSSPHNAYTLH